MHSLISRRLAAIVLIAVAGRTPRAQAEVTAYPIPKGMEPSPDYQLTAGGKSIFVYKTPAFSMATFETTGETDVEVKVQRPITRPVVRPLARGIKPVAGRGSLRIRLPGPCQLAVEVDEDLRRPLFLFANAPERDAPRRGGSRVRYFEGGRIHEAGRIDLKNDETVYLAGGSVVRAIIRANNVSGARILGPGILDGSTRTTQTRMVELEGCKDIEINGVIFLGSYGWTIVPRFSENIRVRGAKVLSWRDNDDGCDPVSSQQVTVENCFFRTKDDCIAVKAHDDPKTVRGTKPDPSTFNVDDVRVTNSIFWSAEWGHALTVGFAVRAPAIRNVSFSNCDIIKKEKGPALGIHNHDLGAVENVRFENIRVEDGCDKLLAVKVAFSHYSTDCPMEYFRNNPGRKEPTGEAWLKVLEEKRSSARGTIRNVLFDDIQVLGDRLPSSEIRGFSPRNEVGDILLKGIRFQGRTLGSPEKANLKIQNATDVRFEE